MVLTDGFRWLQLQRKEKDMANLVDTVKAVKAVKEIVDAKRIAMRVAEQELFSKQLEYRAAVRDYEKAVTDTLVHKDVSVVAI